MKLESVQFKHTGLFQQLEIQFCYTHKPITLILGDQASGKTTLLKHIFQALSWFPARLKDNRTSGIVMLDQDISNTKTQSKIHIAVKIPPELGQMPEQSETHENDTSLCTWKLLKTLNTQGIGISQVDTQALEYLTELYHKALKQDPLQGLPCIAYYPSDRFVNEINLLNKNIPAVFLASSAYDVGAVPFTTFARFFEWFREISDIENAQRAHALDHILDKIQQHSLKEDVEHQFLQMQAQLKSPNLKALKTSLNLIFPEITDIYLQYQPKLQLMLTYKGQTLSFQQLSNSLKTWVALIGDLVRRLCLLNPLSLYPCREGEGIVLIDQIDQQLDQSMCEKILLRLHEAFPCLQIIATGNREELLEHAAQYQCLQLDQQQLLPLKFENTYHLHEQIYQNLFSSSIDDLVTDSTLNLENSLSLDQVIQNIDTLDAFQKEQIYLYLQNNLYTPEQNKLLKD